MELLKSAVLLYACFQSISWTYGRNMFEEPMCSKFHFEEHLLEKVVRFEVKLDTIAKQLQADQDTLNKEKAQLVQDTQKFKDDVAGDIRDMKTSLEARQTDVEGRVDRLLETAEGHVARMSRDVQAMLNKTVAEITSAANVPPVAFTARHLSEYMYTPAAGETLVFTEVDLNEGGGYDRNTGWFTVPVTGVYMFTVQMCLNAEKWVTIRIVDGDGEVLHAALMSRGKPYNGCLSTVAVASLNQTEIVMAQSGHATASGTIHIPSPSHRNVFSGVLIHN